jgi:predicted DsbA family dithiol-disulfide isomerase
MHQRLFRHPQVLEQSNLVQYAKELGLDHQRFAACLNGEMTSKLERDKKLAATLGVNVTPTFLISTIEEDSSLKVRRILRGALPYSAFKAVLDELLG